jgi:hypothetical protein
MRRESVENQYRASRGLGRGRNVNVRATEILRRVAFPSPLMDRQWVLREMEIALNPLARGKR